MSLLELIFGKRSSAEAKRVRQYYDGLLRQKEREIDELKKENALLLQNALTQAQKRSEMADHAQRLIEINRELKKKLEGKENAS